MATTCDECGGDNKEVIKSGIFKGQKQELDYCTYCYQDLCSDCMKTSYCDGRDSPLCKHKIHEESD